MPEILFISPFFIAFGSRLARLSPAPFLSLSIYGENAIKGLISLRLLSKQFLITPFSPFFSRSQKKTLFRGKHAIDIFRTLRLLHLLPYYLPMQSNHFTGEMKQEAEINRR